MDKFIILSESRQYTCELFVNMPNWSADFLVNIPYPRKVKVHRHIPPVDIPYKTLIIRIHLTIPDCLLDLPYGFRPDSLPQQLGDLLVVFLNHEGR